MTIGAATFQGELIVTHPLALVEPTKDKTGRTMETRWRQERPDHPNEETSGKAPERSSVRERCRTDRVRGAAERAVANTGDLSADRTPPAP